MSEYKRRNYLINPKFQLRFSLMICIIILLSSIVYPITIYDLISKYIAIASVKNPTTIPILENYRTTLISILTIWQIGFTALVFVICIFFSHKIAGPIYKLKNFLTGIRETSENGILFFRKSDYFHEVATEINATFEHLENKAEKDKEVLKEKLKALESSLPEEHKDKVKEILKGI